MPHAERVDGTWGGATATSSFSLPQDRSPKGKQRGTRMGTDNQSGHLKCVRQHGNEDTHHPCYTLKIRGGCDTYMKRDGKIGTAGKGALIQTDLASTLGVSQDQYLFEPTELCLNDQGGGVMDVSYEKAGTLMANTAYKHPWVILEKTDEPS